MILTWKIVLLIIVFISFMGAVAEADKTGRTTLGAICIASIFALTTTFIVL